MTQSDTAVNMEPGERMKAVYSFEFNTLGDHGFTISTKPIYDESGKLLGAFTLVKGEQAKAWLSGNDSEVGLKVSTGEPFYVTVRHGDDGQIDYALVSELPVGILSTEVTAKLEAIHEI